MHARLLFSRCAEDSTPNKTSIVPPGLSTPAPASLSRRDSCTLFARPSSSASEVSCLIGAAPPAAHASTGSSSTAGLQQTVSPLTPASSPTPVPVVSPACSCCPRQQPAHPCQPCCARVASHAACGSTGPKSRCGMPECPVCLNSPTPELQASCGVACKPGSPGAPACADASTRTQVAPPPCDSNSAVKGVPGRGPLPTPPAPALAYETAQGVVVAVPLPQGAAWEHVSVEISESKRLRVLVHQSPLFAWDLPLDYIMVNAASAHLRDSVLCVTFERRE